MLSEEVQGVGCIYPDLLEYYLHPQIRSKPHILVLCISLFRSASICRYIPGVNMEICTGCQYGDMYRVSIWRYVQGVNMEIYTGCKYGDKYRVSIWRYVQGVNMEIYTGCQCGDIYRV